MTPSNWRKALMQRSTLLFCSNSMKANSFILPDNRYLGNDTYAIGPNCLNWFRIVSCVAFGGNASCGNCEEIIMLDISNFAIGTRYGIFIGHTYHIDGQLVDIIPRTNGGCAPYALLITWQFQEFRIIQRLFDVIWCGSQLFDFIKFHKFADWDNWNGRFQLFSICG